MTISLPCLLAFHVLCSAGVLFPLFLPQDTVNALAELFGFFYLVFECKIPLIERFSFGGQLSILRFPCLCLYAGSFWFNACFHFLLMSLAYDSDMILINGANSNVRGSVLSIPLLMAISCT